MVAELESWKEVPVVSKATCVTHLLVVAINHFPPPILSAFGHFCIFPRICRY